MTVVDAWAQHPTARFLRSDFLASLKRWSPDAVPAGEPPVEATLQAMDAAGVDTAILSAWHGPQGALISNDEVAAIAAQHPGRFAALASVDITKPMEAVRELRRRPVRE